MVISLFTGSESSFLFAGAKFSAEDAPDTQYTLLGADRNAPRESHVGLPQVLLSEVLEYSLTKFSPEGSLHLLPYKLWHAVTLADYGYSDLAEKYPPL